MIRKSFLFSPHLYLSFLLMVSYIGYTAPSYPVDSIHVTHYDLRLDVTNIQGKQLVGHTSLRITPSFSPVYTLELDLFKLTIDSIRFQNNPIAFTYNDTNIRLLFPTAMTTGDTALLDIYYRGIPKIEPYGWGGFHFSGNTLAYNLGIALLDVPHNYGRVWFPCIDNFTDKASYDFYITATDPLMAVCNGMLQSQVSLGNGTTLFHWRLSEKIPAYLASVAVSNYTPVQGIAVVNADTIPWFVYVKPADTTKAKNSFINLSQVIQVFTTRFGDYRWPRVGFVSTPLGAMEHATNIAYPTSSINGTLASEWLYAHELSHQWFGDLVTCQSAGDMWINEGWAVFSEGIFKEGIYGTEAKKAYVRGKHHDVLKLTHYTDGGFLPLAGMPENHTYGSTVYEKGGMVVHTLRGYMGDSLFFRTVKEYTDSFAFQSISSARLRDFFTNRSGINLNAFFDTWVFHEGFPHFSIDSFRVSPQSTLFDVTVFVRQRQKGTQHISDQNILEVQFFGSNRQSITDTIRFSGLLGAKTFSLPFNPVWVALDPEEKIADATTDVIHTFPTAGTFTFPQTYCSVTLDPCPDTAMVRVIHNWVAPDSLPQPVPGFTMSPSRFWTVEGILPQGCKGSARFSYSKFNHLDDALITDVSDSLVLLFRPNTATPWQSLSTIQNGSTNVGELWLDSLRTGEYTLGIWDHDFLGIRETEPGRAFKIAPNPARNALQLHLNNKTACWLTVYNNSGQLIDSQRVDPGRRIINWAPPTQSPGMYLFHLNGKDFSKPLQAKGVLLP